MSGLAAPLVNDLLYQTGWFVLVAGAASGRPRAASAIAAALLALHRGMARDRQGELTLVMLGGVMGTIIDSVLTASGLVQFASGLIASWLCPPWVTIMWMRFATLFRGALGWLQGRPALGALLGAMGGPTAYAAGEALGSIDLRGVETLIVLGIVWAAVIPVLLSAAAGRGVPGAIYRFERA